MTESHTATALSGMVKRMGDSGGGSETLVTHDHFANHAIAAANGGIALRCIMAPTAGVKLGRRFGPRNFDVTHLSSLVSVGVQSRDSCSGFTF